MPPRVPTYERQVQPGALPGVRVAGDVPTGNVQAPFKAASETADVAAKLAQQEKQRADDTWGKLTYAEMVRRKNNLLHGEGGALRKQGRDALGAVGETEEAFGRYTEELEKTAANETQRAMIAQFAEREGVELRGNLQRHAAQETKRLEDQAFKALTESLTDDSVNSPEKAGLNLSMLRAAAQDYADKQGWQGDEGAVLRQSLVDGLDSRVHGGVVRRMLAQGQDLAAKDYFDRNKDAIKDADTRTALEAALEAGTRMGEAQRESDRILGSFSDESVALDEAKKIKDPEVRQDTEARIRRGFDDKRRFNAQAYADGLNNAWTEVEQKGQRPNAVLWTALKSDDRREIDRYIAQKSKGEPIETNWATYYGLKRMAMNPTTRGQFVGENLWGYRNKLSDGEFKELVNMQVGLSRGDGQTEKTLDGFRSDDSIVKDALTAAGIDSTPKPGTDAAEQVALFRRRVDEEVAKVQSRTGKKASNDEIQGIVDNLMLRVVTDEGWLWDTKKRSFEVGIKDVPQAEQALIVDALRRAGRPVTEQSVSELYMRKLQRDKRAQ